MARKTMGQIARERRAAKGGTTRNIVIPSGRGGGRSSRIDSGVTEVSKGLFRYRDPKTGKLSFTSSREFAESSAKSGTPEFTQEFQERYRSGGGRGGGTPKSFASEQAAKDALRRAEILRIATAQAKIKSDAARAKALDAQAKQEMNRIAALQSRIINQKGRVIEKQSRDVRTGNILNITEYKQGSNKVRRVYDTVTGEIKFTTFGVGKGGGGVRQTGGVTLGGEVKPATVKTAADIAATYQIIPTASPKYIFVRMPNGKHVRMGTSGKGIIGKELAGHKLLFENGVIIAVDGKTTFARDEYVTPTGAIHYAPPKGSFWAGLQKTIISKRFRSKKVAKDQEKKEEKWDNLMNKMKNGEKFNQTDISNYKEIAKFTPEKLVDKDVARFAQITGGAIGTVVAPIPGAVIWAMGDTMEKVRTTAADGKKVSKAEFGKIVLDSATRGAILGFSMKMLGRLSSLASKKVILRGAMIRLENNAIRAAVNHGGILIKLVGRSGKNFITTYFLKDMAGNVFDVTADVKAGRLNNAYRKAIETGGAIGGYIGGSAVAGGLIQGTLFVRGRYKPKIPEVAQKKIPADVMAKQLLSEGKIVLTRRGVYETGKGLSPRKDAWLDSKIKNPTKSVFWRFDKTLSPKDQAIMPLPQFTKSKAGYLKMFNANWNKNRGMNLLKRYIKTTAETPLANDVIIRQIIRLKDIKDIKLRKQIIREYATRGKLSKATQAKVLKNPKFGISDKNREFGFHDENEFVTRTGFKLKGRKDISWTYDASIGEYVPVVESLKTTNRIKNFLSVLNKKKIITRTDAKFIIDNYAIKKKFGSASILPDKHSWTHMKQVQNNIVQLMKKYPEFNPYWKKKYGSVAKAKEALKQAMWHDIGKGESASKAFGTPHGEKVWNVWKAKLLPKGLKFKPRVAKAIKKHETLDPRKLWYKIQNRIKLVTPEQKIVATADRLDLNRVGIKIDLARLPLKDAIKRLGIKVKWTEFPSSFNKIIAKIKIDKGVTKEDLKKIFAFIKSKVVLRVKVKKYKSKKSLSSYSSGISAGKRAGLKAPKNYNVNHKGNKKAYIDGYKEGYSGRYLINYKTGKYKLLKRRVTPKRKRPTPKRIPKKRPTRRPAKRPPKRPTKRPPKRPARRPPKRPPRKPPSYQPKLPNGFKKRNIPKKVNVYYIKIKKKGRMVNLTPRPLVLSEAKDLLAWSEDKNLVRSGYFYPLGKSKKVIGLPKEIKGYFSRNKRKFRPHRIKHGVKKQILNGFIERKKYIGDTKQEIRQLQAARKRTTKRKSTIKRKRRIKPTQRKGRKKTKKVTPKKKTKTTKPKRRKKR